MSYFFWTGVGFRCPGFYRSILCYRHNSVGQFKQQNLKWNKKNTKFIKFFLNHWVSCSKFLYLLKQFFLSMREKNKKFNYYLKKGSFSVLWSTYSSWSFVRFYVCSEFNVHEAFKNDSHIKQCTLQALSSFYSEFVRSSAMKTAKIWEGKIKNVCLRWTH